MSSDNMQVDDEEILFLEPFENDNMEGAFQERCGSPSLLENISDITNINKQPITCYGLINGEDFKGDFIFDAYVNPWAIDKRNSKLTFIEADGSLHLPRLELLPMVFVWDYHISKKPLYVRATPVVTLPQQIAACKEHEDESSSHRHHMLVSAQTDHDIMYCGSIENANSHLSVLFKCPESPTDNSSAFYHKYKFICTSTCLPLKYRGYLHVIFTLEDESGNIHGRRSLKVRIIKNEEEHKELTRKRKISSSTEHEPKRPRLRVDLTQPENLVVRILNNDWTDLRKEQFQLIENTVRLSINSIINNDIIPQFDPIPQEENKCTIKCNNQFSLNWLREVLKTRLSGEFIAVSESELESSVEMVVFIAEGNKDVNIMSIFDFLKKSNNDKFDVSYWHFKKYTADTNSGGLLLTIQIPKTDLPAIHEFNYKLRYYLQGATVIKLGDDYGPMEEGSISMGSLGFTNLHIM